VEKPEDCDVFLNEQLKRLKTDHIDFYLLHGLFGGRWQQVIRFDILNWVKKAKADGRIGHVGFSFHGTNDSFMEIIGSYDWEFCLIQYNYMNEEFQAGSRGLSAAAAQGMAVVVMEPLLGGTLAAPQGRVKEIWQKADKDPVDVAFRWLWHKPQVAIALSGMSTMEQVRHNLSIASCAHAESLSGEELDLIEQVKRTYADLNPIPCTKCEYCLPCPRGVNIPRNFDLYNQAIIYDNLFLGKAHYNWHSTENERAVSCIGCAECEEKCPQGIRISKLLPKVHETLFIK